MTAAVVVEDLPIGEMAASSGLSIHTLGYYERIGLIAAIARLSNGQRRYSRDTAHRVESLAYLHFGLRAATTVCRARHRVPAVTGLRS